MRKNVEQKITCIINSLLPETAFRNRYAEKTSLADRMSYYKTPGVSVAVVNDYEVEWARGFGVREWWQPHPVTKDTVFQAGSISKPVFAIAVIRLMQEGALDLDEDVNNYLTSWRIPANDSWQPRITLRQILSHSAGLKIHGFPGYLQTETLPTVAQVLGGEYPANTKPVQTNIVPGTQFRYSGGGTTIAQQLVVDVLDKPFTEIMRELVFEPLGLTHSTYEQPLPAAWAKMAATAHPWKYQPVAGGWHVYPEMAAAGLWSTPSDLARIGLEVQLAIKGKSDFMKKDLARQMLTPQISRGSTRVLHDSQENMGIGFLLDGKDETIRFKHGGTDEGFEAHMIFYRELGIGSVEMINSNQGHDLVFEIERAIAMEYGWPDYLPKEKVASKVPEEDLRKTLGTYVAKSGLRFKVEHGGDNLLLLRATGQPPIGLYPESETKFFAMVVNLEVAFKKTKRGEVEELILHQDGTQMSARRTE
jgi:CubicO group peptidase (beta-lactamase class C family)